MNRIGIEAFNIIKQNTGIGYYSKSLIEELQKINMYEYTKYINDSAKNDIRASNLKGYHFNNKLIELYYRHYKMSKIADKDNLDVYHGTAFYLPKGIRCKKVVTVHDLCAIKYPESFNKSRILHGKLFLKDSIMRADKIIAVSNSTKNDIINYFDIDERKIKVVYLGARKVFQPAAEDNINFVKKKFKIDRYILSVGTLEPRKNLISLLKAFNHVKNKIDSEVKLVLVGKSGWLNGEILSEANKLGDRIVLTGYISDKELQALYSGSDLFAYPSLYEGFGLPVLEAMACGANILTSNVSSLPEVVGNCAVLIDPLDIESITYGLLEALGKDKDVTRKNAITRSEKFSWETCAYNTNKIYSELINS